MELSSEKLSDGVTYDVIYDKLPEDKRPISLEDLQLIRSANITPLSDVLNELDEELAKKYKGTEINYQDNAFHHLLNGSGLPLKVWQSIEPDTKDGDYAKLVSSYLESLKKAA